MYVKRVVITGLYCHGRRCGKRLRDAELPVALGVDHYLLLGLREGWSFWSGRTKRCYCPSCRPQKGHKMVEVTSDLRERLAFDTTSF